MDEMKIITPSYPAINSVHNVMPCTLEIINQELDRGTVTYPAALYYWAPSIHVAKRFGDGVLLNKKWRIYAV